MTNQPTDPSQNDIPELPLDDVIAQADRLLAEESDYLGAASEAPGEAKKRDPSAPRREQSPQDAPSRLPGEGPELPPLKRKKSRVLRVLLCILLVLTTLVGLLGVGADRWLHAHILRGREQVVADYDNVVLSLPEENKNVIPGDDGKTVHYKGHKYRLNENVATVLFMGVDRKNMLEVDTPGTAGQADVVLLMAIDTVTGKANLINISREAYAEIRLWSADGNPGELVMRQLCVAYAYGNGRETSCDNMVEAVSKLLYGLPIEKYIALDMDGVLAANEAVGGITLTSLSDLKVPDGGYISKGQEITLHGEYCERYVRARDDEMDSNEERMARQRQYMQAFLAKLMSKARSDLGTIGSLYDTLSPYMVTNLDLSDALFLAQVYLDHGLQMKMLHVAGTYDWLNWYGENNAVYYLDNDSLFEAVLAAYYTKVD